MMLACPQHEQQPLRYRQQFTALRRRCCVVGVVAVIDNETITVALLYAAMMLIGPVLLTRIMQWANSREAANLALEIGYAIEGVTR